MTSIFTHTWHLRHWWNFRNVVNNTQPTLPPPQKNKNVKKSGENLQIVIIHV